MPRKKNRIEEPIPIQMVNRMKSVCPDIFTLLDGAIGVLKKREDFSEVKWDDLCYIPSFMIIEFTKYMQNNDKRFAKHFDSNCVSELLHLSAWRQYKQVYSFDADLADILMESATDEICAYDLLGNLPFPSFYVEFSRPISFGGIGDDVIGMFASFDIFAGKDLMLDFLAIHSNSAMTSVPIHIAEGMTIQDSIREINRIYNMTDEYVSGKVGELPAYKLSEFAQRAFQIVMYICAANADMSENAKQKAYMRRPTSKSQEKDIAREIQKWDVGYRIGQVIRMHGNADNPDESEKEHKHIKSSRKRPHVRRGHFHHYWTGSKEDRKLILKWNAPTFIHADIGDLPATICKVV